jgi:hypothetical protein
MRQSKPDPSKDPSLFEYSPQEASDEDVFESMANRGVAPKLIVDPVERERYVSHLEQNGFPT